MFDKMVMDDRTIQVKVIKGGRGRTDHIYVVSINSDGAPCLSRCIKVNWSDIPKSGYITTLGHRMSRNPKEIRKYDTSR